MRFLYSCKFAYFRCGGKGRLRRPGRNRAGIEPNNTVGRCPRAIYLRFGRLSAVVLLIAACLPGFLPQTARADDFKDKALAAEKRHDWLEACRWYDKGLRKDRNQPEVRDAYQRCLRRLYLVRRCQDRVYREAVAKLTPAQALDVYEQVLGVVGSAYVDPSRTDVNSLFQQGVQELRYDFDEDVFLQEYLAGAKPAAVAKFRKALDDWQTHKVKSRIDAHEEVLALIQAARGAGLDLKPSLQTAIGLEFSAGACNALDEYTLFLTPGYYNDVQAMLQGKFVSIGVDLGLTADGQVEIVRVYPKSPAEAKLLPHDRIVRINRQGDLTPDQAADLLRGEAGTVVDVEYQSGRPQGRGPAAATAGLPAERRGPAGAERHDRNGDGFDRLRPDQPLPGFDRSGREGGAGPAADGRGAGR